MNEIFLNGFPKLTQRNSRRKPGACRRQPGLAATIAAVALLPAIAGAAGLDWAGGQPGGKWDVGDSLNWLQGGVPSAFANGDAVRFGDLGVTFSPVIATLVQPSAITVEGTNNYQFTGSGSIDGATGLTKEGTGTLVIGNANTFTGPVVVNDGVLQYGIAGALGAGAGYVYATNHGSVDISKTDTGLRTIAIAGAGYEGQGAIINTSTDSGVNNLVGAIELLGDATVSSVGRWNVKTAGTVAGNGHKLTKIGLGSVWLYKSGASGLGDIEVVEGTFGAYPPVDLGDPAKTLTVQPGATLALWRTTDNAAPFDLDKKLVLNGATVTSGFTPANEGSNVWIGPVAMTLTNTFSVSSGDLFLSNSLSGSGGFIKTGARNLYLLAANSYAGPTIIQGGKVILGPNATLGSGDLIEFRGGSTLDVNAKASGLVVGNGQTVIGVNNAKVAGNVSFQSGSLLDIGKGRPGVVTVNNLSLGGATVKMVLGSDPNDLSGSVSGLIDVLGDLTTSGVNTFVIEPLGALDNFTPYTVARLAGAFNGAVANLQAASANPNYTFTFLDPAATWPYLQVMATGEPVNLLWRGGDSAEPNTWNRSVVNWINRGNAQPSVFYNGSPALFDDTAVTKNVTVAEDLGAILTFQHASGNYVFTGPGALTGALTQEGAGTITLATTNLPALSSIVNDSGTLVLDSPVNATISAAISSTDGGQGRIIKSGTNIVTLTGDNLAYGGTLVVTNGVLRYNNLKALGAPVSTLYATNGGTLDLNHIDAGLKTLAIAGEGYQGQGAISHSSTDTSLVNIVGNLEFLADATLGSMGRWNTKVNGTVRGNGHKMTKVGTGQFWFYNCGDPNLGDIEVVGGTLGIHAGTVPATSFGDPSKTLTLQPGTTLSIWQVPFADKKLVLNRATVSSGFTGTGSNTFSGPITLNLTNTFSLGSADLHLSNSISGGGGLIKSGARTLFLHRPAAYTGPTIINNNSGTVVLGAASSLASKLIQVGTTSTLDVSQLPALSLGAGQVLGGNNGVVSGNVVIGSGATLQPGLNDTATWALQITGNLTIQAGGTNRVVVNKTSAIANSKVTGFSSAQLGGTLAVVLLGNPLAAGDAISLFEGGSRAGAFAAITPATPGPGLEWDGSTLAADGKLRVIGGGVDPTPTNITAQVTPQQVTLSWPQSHLGWILEAQTNAPGAGLDPDPRHWTRVPGSESATQAIMGIDPANGSVFYRLRLP